jgi:hypothetical protein
MGNHFTDFLINLSYCTCGLRIHQSRRVEFLDRAHPHLFPFSVHKALVGAAERVVVMRLASLPQQPPPDADDARIRAVFGQVYQNTRVGQPLSDFELSGGRSLAVFRGSEGFGHFLV